MLPPLAQMPALRWVASGLAVAMPMLVLLRWGGSGAWTLQLASLLTIALGIMTTMTTADRMRLPSSAVIHALLVPLLLIDAVQLLPVGFVHPWVLADAQELGAKTAVRSFDFGSGLEAMGWRCCLLIWALCALQLWRAVRSEVLLAVFIWVVSVHALGAMLLAVLAPDFPMAGGYSGRVRGTFTYPNHAAALWLMGLVLAIPWAIREAMAGRIFSLMAPALLLLGILTSASRSGTILAVLAVVVVGGWNLRGRVRWWAWPLVIASTITICLAVGLGQLGDRFSRLDGMEGQSLNGRLNLWSGGWSLVGDAGWLGFGANSVPLIWRRTGIDTFEPQGVRHLHNDYLELLVEQGWIAPFGLLLGLIVAAYRMRDMPQVNPQRRWLLTSIVTSLLAVLVFGAVDFPFQSPAVMLAVMYITVVFSIGKQRRSQALSHSTSRHRLSLAVLVVLAVGILLTDWKREGDSVQAWYAERNAGDSASSPLPVRSTLSAQYAIMSARQSLNAQAIGVGHDPSRVKKAMSLLDAHLGLGEAWVERARYALAQGDRPAMRRAVEAMELWCPGWPRAQDVAIWSWAAGGIDDDAGRRWAERLVRSDEPRSSAVVEQVATVLGKERFVADLLALPDNSAMLGASFEWLAHYASFDDWAKAVRKRLDRDGLHLAPHQVSLAQSLHAGGSWLVRVPKNDAALLAVIDQLRESGLPIPLALSSRCVDPPMALSLIDPDPNNKSEIENALTSFADWMAIPRVKVRRDELMALLRGLGGHPDDLTRGSRPDYLAAALVSTRDRMQQGRLRHLLEGYSVPRWRILPGGAWAWWLVSGSSAPVVVSPPRWSAVVVDGDVVAWIRGQSDLRLYVPRGLHRVAVLEFVVN